MSKAGVPFWGHARQNSFPLKTGSAAVACALFLLAVPAAPPAQESRLPAVLKHAATYVSDFAHRVSGLAAEELYVQDIEEAPGRRAPGLSHRELKSDLLLVQIPGNLPVEFRDVFEVDGQPVRDRGDRLTRLFLNPASGGPQAAEIVAESARYNIGRVVRTMNTPMLPLIFLSAAVQRGFEFKRAPDATPTMAQQAAIDSGHFTVSAEVWVVEYREKQRGTIIRTPEGRDLPSHGRFWLDPNDGRVLQSELITETPSAPNIVATIDVSYQTEPELGLPVPAQMRERYEFGIGQAVTGAATYGHFRKVSVGTDEPVAAPDGKK
jgi:hypothetical protein